MPIKIRYKNMQGHECPIRPTPLISIGVEILKTPAGDAFGVTYNITLAGTLLPDEGTPFATNSSGGSRNNTVTAGTDGLFPFWNDTDPEQFGGPYGTFDQDISVTRPTKQLVPTSQASQAILMKQRALRALFADDGQRMEITDTEFDSTPIICFPRIKSINFTEGIYINKCDYTIELEADTLYTYGAVDAEGNRDVSNYIIYNSILGDNEDDFLQTLGNAYIKDFSENWSVDTDESSDEIVTPFGVTLPRKYSVSHSISATGKDHYHPYFGDNLEGTGNTDTDHGTHTSSDFVERLDASTQARKFIETRLAWNIDVVNSIIRNYVGPTLWNSIGAGLAAYVMTYYKGFDHQRTENVDSSAGSYSINDTWVLRYDDGEREETKIAVSTNTGDPFVRVSINGTIKGQSNASANISGGVGVDGLTAWQNTLARWNTISNNGQFGVGCILYKRCNNAVAVQLNSAPLSIAVDTNERASEIGFSIEFDNRPTNFISNTLSESINVSDTYPGDVFSVIPVIGRPTGPILQYIGGRTEYKRSVSINLQMDYTNVAYSNDRRQLMLLKPSINNPQAGELAAVLKQLSPANEPGIRKYFINPPNEQWSPKDGSYTFNIEFTYEIDT